MTRTGIGTGRLALVVEDDEDLRKLIHRVLSAHGFRVEVATDGLSGLKCLETLRPDIIICDVMMPQLDGVTFTKALKSHPDTEKLKVLFLSARTDVNSVVHGMKAGAAQYLGKPFKRDEFLEAVRQVIEE